MEIRKDDYFIICSRTYFCHIICRILKNNSYERKRIFNRT